MKLCILLSCMHEKDHSIVERSNVRTDCVVVNQCDCESREEFDFDCPDGARRHCLFISTRERGLSRSRNMALRNAPDDAVCIIADDDERFSDDLPAIVADAWKRNPEAGAITFALVRDDLPADQMKTYRTQPCKVGFADIMRTSSQQITFSRSRIMGAGIRFDEKMGSGTGNGGGEENKFLLDIRRSGLGIFFDPGVIATVTPGESQWFHGFDARYIENLGWTSKRTMGLFVGFAYICYWVATHRSLYAEYVSRWTAFRKILKGFFSKR